jgi:outer membrane protein
VNVSALTAYARRAALSVLLAMVLPSLAVSQQAAPAAGRTLSLDDAFRLAEPNSDDVRIARNAVTRAKGNFLQTRASVLPQITASANYQRQLQNQFDAITRRFAQPPDPNAPPDTTPQVTNPIQLLFAARNTITLGLQASQPLYVDGRFQLANRVARANEDVYKYGLRTARAKLRYDIATAYFDAVIAEKFLQIAESTLVQTERTLKQTTLQRQVGTVAEYDLLRSRVAVDAQRPLVIQAQQTRDVAALQLKQLLNIPLTERLQLATPVQDADMDRVLATSQLDSDARPSAGSGLTATAQPSALPQLAARDTSPDSRTAVLQAKALVEVQKGALRQAQLQQVPVFNLSTNYQRFAYPSDQQIVPRSFADFFPGWTVSLGFSVPIWTSGRITGDKLVAQANLADAQARVSQGQRAAALDVELALASLAQAQATWLSSIGTEEQADKALRIAEVRYNNGISTQLELADIRNLLIQSQANRLSAARNLQLARLRLTLLRDLPLGSGAGTVAGAGAGAGAGAQTGGDATQSGTGGSGTTGQGGGATANRGSGGSGQPE